MVVVKTWKRRQRESGESKTCETASCPATKAYKPQQQRYLSSKVNSQAEIEVLNTTNTSLEKERETKQKSRAPAGVIVVRTLRVLHASSVILHALRGGSRPPSPPTGMCPTHNPVFCTTAQSIGLADWLPALRSLRHSTRSRRAT
jgi:hypothetical protein